MESGEQESEKWVAIEVTSEEEEKYIQQACVSQKRHAWLLLSLLVDSITAGNALATRQCCSCT